VFSGGSLPSSSRPDTRDSEVFHVKHGRLVVATATALCLTAAVAVSRAARVQPVAAAAQASTRSCKPQPPVRLTLTPAESPGVWRLHLDAIAPAEVTVEMGARAGATEVARQIVWRGALGQGSVRDLEARLAVGPEVTSVWAEANAAGGGALRSVAVVETSQGKPVSHSAVAPSTGRLVTNPATGETVVQYPGVRTGSR
jgi:hypothetical protein